MSTTITYRSVSSIDPTRVLRSGAERRELRAEARYELEFLFSRASCNNHLAPVTITTIAESAPHTLDPWNPALKQLFERVFYGITDTNSSFPGPVQFPLAADETAALRGNRAGHIRLHNHETLLTLIHRQNKHSWWGRLRRSTHYQKPRQSTLCEGKQLVPPFWCCQKTTRIKKSFSKGRNDFFKARAKGICQHLRRGSPGTAFRHRLCQDRSDHGGCQATRSGQLLREGRTQATQSLKELVRTEKWLNDHGYDIEAHSQFKTPSDRTTLKAKLSSTASGARATGKMKGGSQRAADGGPGSAVNQTGDSATGRGGEDLKHIEFEVPLKEPEEQSESGMYTHEDVEDRELESQASSQ
ncbi:hypothetical protein M407DRAFT_10228 [Tulasnella calospora MUT 4182]|uniref:Uncharacterized protein n=1 Tax=Tulasnella calospora MUT 4182 TaxID=1051891 RepID=A0A0C3KK16_9AGAM|nr:hypothetical protein M407DRAFT_10228 [Tulasnella calospora MUT 4182]